VSDICKRRSCLSSWLRSTRYAVSDICKGRSCLSSWVRGTQCAIWIRDEVVLVASLKNEAYTHFWILVAGCLNFFHS